MSYDVRSRGYLARARARARLDERSCENLFYAAFELRCGVETRLQEYLEPHVETLSLAKVGWRISAMSKILKRDFASGEKIARLRVVSEDSRRVIGTWYHTPVTASLRSKAEHLGEYLHATIPHRPPDHSWWGDMRAALETLYAELWLATRGRLLSMPLMNRETGQLVVSLEADDGASVADLRQLMLTEPRHVLDIAYLDVVPESLSDGA
jgi:hypothetical protein